MPVPVEKNKMKSTYETWHLKMHRQQSSIETWISWPRSSHRQVSSARPKEGIDSRGFVSPSASTTQLGRFTFLERISSTKRREQVRRSCAMFDEEVSAYRKNKYLGQQWMAENKRRSMGADPCCSCCCCPCHMSLLPLLLPLTLLQCCCFAEA